VGKFGIKPCLVMKILNVMDDDVFTILIM